MSSVNVMLIIRIDPVVNDTEEVVNTQCEVNVFISSVEQRALQADSCPTQPVNVDRGG